VRSDRSCVDGVQAVDEFASVTVAMFAGDVEKRLSDRERRAQFVGGVGCESLLFGDVCFEAARAWCRRRRRVRGTRRCGPRAGFGGRVIRSQRGVWRLGCESGGRACVRRGSHPPSRPNTSRNVITTAAGRSEIAQEVAVALHDEDHPRVHTTRKGEIPGDEEHGRRLAMRKAA